MRQESLLELLTSIEGETLERAYELLRAKVIAKRKAALERARSSAQCFLLLATNKPPGQGTTSVIGKVGVTPASVQECLRPSDRVLKLMRLSEAPTGAALRGLVDELFQRLNKHHENCAQLSILAGADGSTTVSASATPRWTR